ncbi:bifunctional DNA primase/polymerase [Rhizobium sp. LjRoot30]|uniref:bifunctional DNA primase/polymerase n=1 Tax=Rhizobium sp. LjRoot30 TaxID=3342320 RepID=UPI003ECF7A33
MRETKQTPGKLANALALAEQGFRIFPLSPRSKKPPRDFAWKEEATTDPDRIREWWKADANYNVGVATGGGTIVVDADTKEGAPGLASLEMLELACGMPKSFRVQTPSGGMHVYLRVDQTHRNRVHSIPDYPGIDIRSDNGYVVGPGSVVDGKPYVAIPGAIEPAGAEVEAALLANAPTHTVADSKAPAVELDLPAHVELAKEYLVNRAPEAVEGAGGNETTYTVAARCREYGLTQEATLEIMLEHWNETKAFPAWLPADLQTVVANAYRYATGSWGGGMAVAEFDVVDLGEPVKRLLHNAQVTAGAAARGMPKGVLDYSAMESLVTPEWLIDGLIMENRSSLWFGKSNAFKSFLAIDAALSVATGRPWHGHRVKQGRVLYVATEGAFGVGKLRVPGWYEHHGVPREERGAFFIDTNDNMLDDPNAYRLLADRCRLLSVDLLVLDIFGGTMKGTEVEDTTARAWVRNMVKLLGEGITVLTVAHTGWGDHTRARMHTHFWGSFDSRIKIEGDKDKLTSVASIDRHKDSDSRGKWSFKLQPSHDTLVPEFDTAATSIKPPPTGQARVALSILEKAIAENGTAPDWVGGPEGNVLPIKEWRRACNGSLSAGRGESAHRNAFKRATDELISAGHVENYGEFVWVSAVF